MPRLHEVVDAARRHGVLVASVGPDRDHGSRSVTVLKLEPRGAFCIHVTFQPVHLGEVGGVRAELFAQVAIGLRRFRDEANGSAAPWLYGIAKNLVRRYHEHGRIESAARRRLGMPLRAYELDLDAVDDRLAAAAEPGLAAALESLPGGQREALELRVLEERSYDEVALALGCSETAARLRVMRALGKLARVLRAAN